MTLPVYIYQDEQKFGFSVKRGVSSKSFEKGIHKAGIFSLSSTKTLNVSLPLAALILLIN